MVMVWPVLLVVCTSAYVHKKLSDEVLVWFSVWSKVQMISTATAISCFIKIQNDFTFLILAYPGCPGKEAINGCCCIR